MTSKTQATEEKSASGTSSNRKAFAQQRKQNKNTAYEMGENTYKPCIGGKANILNI